MSTKLPDVIQITISVDTATGKTTLEKGGLSDAAVSQLLTANAKTLETRMLAQAFVQEFSQRKSMVMRGLEDSTEESAKLTPIEYLADIVADQVAQQILSQLQAQNPDSIVFPWVTSTH